MMLLKFAKSSLFVVVIFMTSVANASDKSFLFHCEEDSDYKPSQKLLEEIRMGIESGELPPDASAAPRMNCWYKPVNGVVPNEGTAISIATAIWKNIASEKYLNAIEWSAKLDGDKWVVTADFKKRALGSLPSIEILKTTGEIIKISER